MFAKQIRPHVYSIVTGGLFTPPHCDTLDGPVVAACKEALQTENVNLILPWVPKSAEDELKNAFTKVLHVRNLDADAAELADYWFFETAVRMHREGEGEPYTGLKPAGLDWGPVVPKAEEDIERANPDATIEFLKTTIEEELTRRFGRAMSKKQYDSDDVGAAREYVQSMLEFVLFSHHLYENVTGHHAHGE